MAWRATSKQIEVTRLKIKLAHDVASWKRVYVVVPNANAAVVRRVGADCKFIRVNGTDDAEARLPQTCGQASGPAEEIHSCWPTLCCISPPQLAPSQHEVAR